MGKAHIYLILLLILIPVVISQDSQEEARPFLVINSGDWQDVYSGTIYANLKGYKSRFLMSERHSSWIPKFIDSKQKVIVIESAEIPFVLGYGSVLKGQGYNVYNYEAKDITRTNLYLARNLVENEGTKNFIVLDDSYGYNAISVAPYATLTKSYVLFANEDNINNVLDFLSDVDVESLLLYGQLDDKVLAGLEDFPHERLDAGDRFSNNLEIVKRFVEKNPVKQVLLTNGEFLESEVLSGGDGSEPVLFIGADSVTEQVVDFIKNSDFTIGILVGNEFTTTAKMIKDRTGLHIFIKFAQSSATGGEFQEVKGLDRFMLPSFDMKIDIQNITYNTKTKQLEITYKNDKEMKTYVKSDIGINADGDRIYAMGDKRAFTVKKQEAKGRGYTVDLLNEIRDEKELEATFYIRYGESPKSMEKAIEGKFPISIISKEDVCDMRINSVGYDKGIQRFIIEVENLVNETCYVRPGLIDVSVSDKKVLIEHESVEVISEAGIAVYKIKQRLDDVDIEDNSKINANIIYGSREEFLLKTYENQFELEIVEVNIVNIIIKFISNNKYLILGIILILCVLLYMRKKKQKDAIHKQKMHQKHKEHKQHKQHKQQKRK